MLLPLDDAVGNDGKKGENLLFRFPVPFAPFFRAGYANFGKYGTGDIVSYFHKKIKPIEKCKPMENAQFAIFVIEKCYPHNSQSLFPCAGEKNAQASPASYALPSKTMPGFSTENRELSTCKTGDWIEDAGVSPQTSLRKKISLDSLLRNKLDMANSFPMLLEKDSKACYRCVSGPAAISEDCLFYPTQQYRLEGSRGRRPLFQGVRGAEEAPCLVILT